MRSILLLCFLGITIVQAKEQSFFFKVMDMKQQTFPPPTLRDYERGAVLFYDQTLDHFSVENTKTWKQRYFINDEFFTDKPNSPIFLRIGGEGAASVSAMTHGAWYGYAKEVGALMIQLEHRFYGESHPTENMSVENLKYLTSQQALEDIAQFIAFIKDEFNISDNNKWVTFGGSYPGSLSLWMRSLYPHLVAGALSSSAPVEAKVDFEEYVEIIDKDMGIRDPSCSSSVVEGITQIEELLAMGESGWHEIKKVFRLCGGWSGSKDKDVKTLFMSIVEAFAIGAQYDSNFGVENVDKLCSHMRNEDFGETNMERLARTVNIVYGGECLNANYWDLINGMKVEEWIPGKDVNYRQWIFQTCNEFGWYQTGNLWGSFLPVSYFIDQCTDVYGPQFTSESIEKNVQKSNEFYGSKNPPLSNTIITHGSFDPWHPMGIVHDMSETVKAFVINGTSHCYDLAQPNPHSDSEELTQVRKITFEHIIKWIQ